MTYIDKFCPHCRYRYYHKSKSYVPLGSPVLTCPRCKKTFIDKDYKEPFFELPPKRQTMGKILVRSLLPWGIVFVVLASVGDKFEPRVHFFLLLIPIVLYLLSVTASYLLRDWVYQNRKDEYSASFQRLQDPDYVAVLLDNGCYVAPEFVESTHPQLLKRTNSRTAPDRKSVRYRL